VTSQARRLMALVAAAALVLVACSSSSKSSSSSAGSSGTKPASTATAPAVVNIGFVADMGVPDPDIFYELEGNVVITSAYEGLVQYANNSTKIIPNLATSWTVSPDGLTYTFQLRPNVEFHDGTGTMTSSDVEASFKRRSALGPTSPPGYMLAYVAGYETPSPLTLVIKLTQPVAPFLDYLAAPYGPKVEDAAGLAAHAGSDMDQTWFKTHDLGTGPYTITQFIPNEQYTLTSFPQYWGGAPKVTEIHISILPDISTQQLELQSGQLQMILHGLSKEDEASYENNPKYQVVRFPANFKLMMAVNQHAGIFSDLSLRQALAQAIDRQQIVDDVYGQDATVSTQMYPTGELAPNLGVDNPTFDPSVLANLVKKMGLTGKHVNLEYTNDDARNQRVAGIVQAELQAAGLDATDTGIPLSVAYGLSSNPGQRPDLLLTTTNPDASAPDTWVRIYLHTVTSTDGSLNYLDCSVPAADQAMDTGLHDTTPAAVDAAYGQAGDLLATDACEDNIADVKDVIVADAGYSGWFHQPPNLFTVKFGDLQLTNAGS
jgi:peptide/nickel transport system substrate-binding protein